MNYRDFQGIAEIVISLFAGLAILTPIIALSMRFALKPMLETWIRFKQSQTSDQDKITQDRRIALLEAEVQSLQSVVQHRVDAQEFDRALGKPGPD